MKSAFKYGLHGLYHQRVPLWACDQLVCSPLSGKHTFCVCTFPRSFKYQCIVACMKAANKHGGCPWTVSLRRACTSCEFAIVLS